MNVYITDKHNLKTDEVQWVRIESDVAEEQWTDLVDPVLTPVTEWLITSDVAGEQCDWLITFRRLRSKNRTYNTEDQWQVMFNNVRLVNAPRDCLIPMSEYTEQELRDYYMTYYLLLRGDPNNVR